MAMLNKSKKVREHLANRDVESIYRYALDVSRERQNVPLAEKYKGKGWKRLHIEGEEWYWRYGRTYCTIVSPTENKWRVDLTKITGRDWNCFQRDQEKGNFSLTPHEVKQYIIANLVS